MWFKSIILLFFLFGTTLTIDRSIFKTCEQSSFCQRCRKVQPDGSPYEFLVSTLRTYSDYVSAELSNKDNGQLFVLKIEGLNDNKFRLLIDEKNPLKPRYRVVDVVNDQPTKPIHVTLQTESEVQIVSGNNKIVIKTFPLKIDFYNGDVHSLSINGKGLMRFEHLRTKPQMPQDEEPGSWEEIFKTFLDSKPNGPEAVALDFTFPNADLLFGIPEHADSFALKSTIGSEPYRLYNLDVFEYELDSRMAIYGAVPVIYGHGQSGTTGVFWLNPSETWVDIYSSDSEKPPTAHFMSESGIMEIYVLLGPSPLDAFKQYTDLTGVTPVPQIYTLGYHQSRWNYNDEQDVGEVHAKFDEFDIPVDTFWLDIEYTDNKKYFTWDQQKFPNSVQMIHNLTDKGRHLVIIIDPHIKRDDNYFFHNDCTERGYYVKNKDGKDFEGDCWPGNSSYPDFFNPVVRKYYADQYQLDKFTTVTEDVMYWNDMNEPSVFNGPEITMFKDNIHYGGWEHRHVHNLYGHMYIMGTFEGLINRPGNKLRPFILSRAHFAGSQKYAAIWTGDNLAKWEHLGASIKMCLSESVAGFSFCGADVGGFFGNPDAELFERWYQAGAFQPFMRAHSHIDTERREPWLFPESTRLIVREAIRKRYSYLAYWYTLFYEHERFGLPIMRPLLSHYPKDTECFSIDHEYLLSDSLLVRPVIEQGVSKVDVYFPIKDEKDGDIWYDVVTYKKFEKTGYESIAVDNSKIPVFQRGGTIIPKKENVRRATSLMHDDPYTLIVALDKNQRATGTLYIDDEKTFDYRQGKYLYLSFEYRDNVLVSQHIDNTTYPTTSIVERVVFIGLDGVPSSATFSIQNTGSAEFTVIKKDNSIEIVGPGISMLKQWSITLFMENSSVFLHNSIYCTLVSLLLLVVLN